MKKVIISGFAALLLISCGGASEEQTQAAKDMCACMDEAVIGEPEFDYYECDIQIQEKYAPEVFADEGWADALEAECPVVADMLVEED